MHPKILYDRPFTFDEIQIEHLGESSRNLDEETDMKISQLWKEETKKAQYPLRDGSIYRLENTDFIDRAEQWILFQMSTISYRYLHIPTRYKTVFTHIGPRRGVFTWSLIQTSDGTYVFGKRTKDGSTGMIGWAIQPDEMVIHSGSDLQKNLYREIHEELGVPPTYITDSTVLWIILHSNTCIGIQSRTQLGCDKKTLETLFEKRTDKEMGELIFVKQEHIFTFLQAWSTDRSLLAEVLEKNW